MDLHDKQTQVIDTYGKNKNKKSIAHIILVYFLSKFLRAEIKQLTWRSHKHSTSVDWWIDIFPSFPFPCLSIHLIEKNPPQNPTNRKLPHHEISNASALYIASGSLSVVSILLLTMERAALLRSLSCTSLASNRFYFRSFVPRAKFSSSSVAVARRNHHRLINNLTRRSLLRGDSRLHFSLSSYSLQFNKHFSSLSPRAVASPSTPSSPGANLSFHSF